MWRPSSGWVVVEPGADAPQGVRIVGQVHGRLVDTIAGRPEVRDRNLARQAEQCGDGVVVAGSADPRLALESLLEASERKRMIATAAGYVTEVVDDHVRERRLALVDRLKFVERPGVQGFCFRPPALVFGRAPRGMN